MASVNARISLDVHSKWRLLRSALRVVSLMRCQEVRDCNLESLEYDINVVPTFSTPSRKKSSSNFRDAVEDYRRKQRFHHALRAGGAVDLEEIKHVIEDDPRRFMMEKASSRSLVNALIEGQTPLYIAAKNGHTDVVRFLLKQGADPLAHSNCDDMQETCLEVAVRWHYASVVQELMKKSWPMDLLKRCRKMTGNKEVRKHLTQPKASCW